MRFIGQMLRPKLTMVSPMAASRELASASNPITSVQRFVDGSSPWDAVVPLAVGLGALWVGWRGARHVYRMKNALLHGQRALATAETGALMEAAVQLRSSIALSLSSATFRIPVHDGFASQSPLVHEGPAMRRERFNAIVPGAARAYDAYLGYMLLQLNTGLRILSQLDRPVSEDALKQAYGSLGEGEHFRILASDGLLRVYVPLSDRDRAIAQFVGLSYYFEQERAGLGSAGEAIRLSYTRLTEHVAPPEMHGELRAWIQAKHARTGLSIRLDDIVTGAVLMRSLGRMVGRDGDLLIT